MVLYLSSGRDDDPKVYKNESTYDFPDYHHSTATKVNLVVAYEPDANPYFVNSVSKTTWSLTWENLLALIENHGRLNEVVVPETLGEMSELPDFDKEMYSTQELFDLAKRYRKNDAKNGAESNIYIMFLDSRLNVDGAPSNSVLGVSLSGTSVIAIFKPVVANVGFTQSDKNYVEQATIIHEVGHAFGLVDVGLSPVNDHVDTEHRGHCKNEDCVMYYANEGGSGAIKIVQQIFTQGNRILFDQNCIEDVRSM